MTTETIAPETMTPAPTVTPAGPLRTAPAAPPAQRSSGSPPPAVNRHPVHCLWCGAALPAGVPAHAIVRDSSVVHTSDPLQDGWRHIMACNEDHLCLALDSLPRHWVDEQLWWGKLRRAGVDAGMGQALVLSRARAAGLTPTQAERALRWHHRGGS